MTDQAPEVPPLDPTRFRIGRPTIVLTNPDGSLKSVTECPDPNVTRGRARRWGGAMLGLTVLAVLALSGGHLAAGGVLVAMASIIPIAFKKALFAGRAWKVAIYVGAANLGNATVGYVASNEVAGAGYTAGGKVLVSYIIDGSDGVTVLLDFDDVSWTAASFTGRYLLVYDNNAANKEGFVIDMGQDQQISGGTFSIIWPLPDLLTAVLTAA